MSEKQAGFITPFVDVLPASLRGKPVDYDQVRHGDTVSHTLTFNTLFSAAEVATTMSAPLNGYASQPDDRMVDRGLKVLTLPGNALYKAGSRNGSDAVSRLKSMRYDILGLSEVLQHPTGSLSDELRVSGYVYDKDTVMIAARDKILDGTAKQLAGYCAAVEPDFDELGVMRRQVAAKFGRHLHLYDLADLGIDPELVREHVIKTEFYKKVIRRVGGFEVVYLDGQTANDEKLRQATRAERIKRLPPLDESDFAERWQLSLQDTSVVAHAAVPVLQWDEQVTRVSLLRPRQKLRYDSAHVVYDQPTNTMLHYSPVLGAAILAQGIEQALLTAQIDKMLGRNPTSRRALPAPDLANGLLPAAMACAAVERTMLLSKRFRMLARSMK